MRGTRFAKTLVQVQGLEGLGEGGTLDLNPQPFDEIKPEINNRNGSLIHYEKKKKPMNGLRSTKP